MYMYNGTSIGKDHFVHYRGCPLSEAGSVESIFYTEVSLLTQSVLYQRFHLELK